MLGDDSVVEVEELAVVEAEDVLVVLARDEELDGDELDDGTDVDEVRTDVIGVLVANGVTETEELIELEADGELILGVAVVELGEGVGVVDIGEEEDSAEDKGELE